MIYSRLKKFIMLPLQKKLLLTEAFFRLGVGRITALRVPIGRIKKDVECDNHRCERKAPGKAADNIGSKVIDSAGSMEEDDGGSIVEIEMIKWAVAVMSRHTPWNSNCFAQALAAHKMLVRRGIPGSMYFGLAKDAKGAMSAHAWLMYRDVVITGGYGKRSFNIVMKIGCE